MALCDTCAAPRHWPLATLNPKRLSEVAVPGVPLGGSVRAVGAEARSARSVGIEF